MTSDHDGPASNVFPIYFGEYFYIGDGKMLDGYRSDETRKRESCNEQCSYWVDPAADGENGKVRQNVNDDGQVKLFRFFPLPIA